MVYATPMMLEVATKVDAPIKLLFPTGYVDAWGRPGFSLLGLGDIVLPGFLLAILLRVDALRHLRGGGKLLPPPAPAPAAEGEADAAAKTPAAAAVTANAPAPHQHEDAADEVAKAASLVHTPFAKPLFVATWAAYAAGLVATITVMHVFNHGQPALVYLVPATLLASAGAALARGEFWALWGYDDSEYLSFFDPDEEEEDAEGEGANGAAAQGEAKASAQVAGAAGADAAPAAEGSALGGGIRQRPGKGASAQGGAAAAAQ
jgi:minor histocompatibility antigen H13